MLHIILADDDKDDCLLFQEALEELSMETTFKVAYDGEQLMRFLATAGYKMPSVLFLDLNMPRKNGYECLREIKRSKKFRTLPVIVLSTSYNEVHANQLYDEGAQYYIANLPRFKNL